MRYTRGDYFISGFFSAFLICVNLFSSVVTLLFDRAGTSISCLLLFPVSPGLGLVVRPGHGGREGAPRVWAHFLRLPGEPKGSLKQLLPLPALLARALLL